MLLGRQTPTVWRNLLPTYLERMEAVDSIEILTLNTRQQGIAFLKTAIFIVTTVRAPNLKSTDLWYKPNKPSPVINDYMLWHLSDGPKKRGKNPVRDRLG